MGSEYVGVEVSETRLRRMLMQNKVWGVFDHWEQGHLEFKNDWNLPDDDWTEAMREQARSRDDD